MIKEKVLIVDDDPDILDVLELTLSEHYEVHQATNGQDGLRLAQEKNPDLIITDYVMPVMDGPSLCRELKKDILLQHTPIIMLTGKGDIKDKVHGMEAGADDYLVKPFEPDELMARIRMILRRTVRSLDANPLTHLPGNVSIMDNIQTRINQKEVFAVGYADLNKFKSYNDKYGFEKGDDIIKMTARILIKAVREKGDPDAFVGHIGGDDYVFISEDEKADEICETIIEEFNKVIPAFYSEEDRRRGYIIAKDRQGREEKVDLLSISIGIVSNKNQKISHIAQVGEIGAELKRYAKSFNGSAYIRDKRDQA